MALRVVVHVAEDAAPVDRRGARGRDARERPEVDDAVELEEPADGLGLVRRRLAVAVEARPPSTKMSVGAAPTTGAASAYSPPSMIWLRLAAEDRGSETPP